MDPVRMHWSSRFAAARTCCTICGRRGGAGAADYLLPCAGADGPHRRGSTTKVFYDTVNRLFQPLLAVEGGQGGSRPLSLPAPLGLHKGCGGPTPLATATTPTRPPPLLFIHQIPMPNQTNRCPQTNASVIARPSQPFCSALAALCPSWELHASTRLTPATPAPLSTPHVKTRHVPVASTDS